MNELLIAKKEDIKQGKEQEGMDLMGMSTSVILVDIILTLSFQAHYFVILE